MHTEEVDLVLAARTFNNRAEEGYWFITGALISVFTGIGIMITCFQIMERAHKGE